MYVKNIQAGDKWILDDIEKVLGCCSYTIKLSLGKTVQRHLDHIKLRVEKSAEPTIDDPMFPTLEQGDEETDEGQSHSDSESDTTPQVEVHRSSHTSHPPERYRPDWS